MGASTALVSLKRALIVLKFSSPIGNKLTCAMSMGRERILPLEIHSNYKTSKMNGDLFVKRCYINF